MYKDQYKSFQKESTQSDFSIQEIDKDKEASNDTQLAFLIDQLARLRGESQASLSKKCGVSRATINRFFRGRTDIKSKEFVKILSVLGLDLESEIKIEVENAYHNPNDRRDQIYQDVVSLLRRLDFSVRKTIFEQIIWWSKLAQKTKATESTKKVSNYLLKMVN